MKGIIVLITAPEKEGVRISKHLVEKRLAACINIASVRSIYWWEGKVQDEGESLLVIKTFEELFEKLKNEVEKIHPYTVPEIVALPMSACAEKYFNWMLETLKE